MAANSLAPQLEAPDTRSTATSPGHLKNLARRSWLVGLGTLAGVGLAYLYFDLVPPQFVSKAQLLVVRKRPDMVPGLERSGGVAEDFLATQAGILKSPLIVERASRAMLDADPAALKAYRASGDVANALVGSLSVKRDPKDKANCILELSFRGTDKEEGKKILDAVITSYQHSQREAYRHISDDTVKAIVQSKTVLENDLARKEAAYLVFRRKNPTLRMKGKVADNIHNEMLLTLHAKRLALRVRRAEIEGLLKTIEKGWKTDSGHEQLIAMIYQLPSRAVADSGGRSQSSFLEDKLLPPLAEEQALLGEYADEHPLVVAARKRVALAYKVVTSILRLDRAGILTAEQSLAELYKTQEEESQKTVSAEVEDEVLRNDIARLQQLADGTIKRLLEVNVVKELGGYEGEVVGPPGVGKLWLLSNPLLIYPALALAGFLGGAFLAMVIPSARR